jgi:hypothetical protein
MKKLILTALAILLGGLFVAVTYSTTDTALVCVGEETIDNNRKPVELTVSLTDYRWWVRLWNDSSDGMLWVESPGTWVKFYPKIKRIGSSWQIYDNDSLFSIVGNLSRISRKLNLKTPQGFYEGKCETVAPL